MRMAPGRGRGHLSWWPLIIRMIYAGINRKGSVLVADGDNRIINELSALAEKMSIDKDFVLKIAVSSDSSNSNARVAQRFGISPYLIIVDPETMEIEAVPNPGAAGKQAAGIQAVVIAISKKVDTVLTGYCSPTAMKYLADNGIDAITGVKGTVAEAVAQYRKQAHAIPARSMDKPDFSGAALLPALKKSGMQLINLLPIFVGVVLLIGLFNAFISKDLLSSIFSENALLDTLFGTGPGGILAGNFLNSYVIGGELLEQGVSLYAVTAFIAAWVTIGLVQLPAEMAALGKKFALIRNALSMVLCMAISILTVVTYSAFSVWN
jgi:predicted Fe-Mo cluster-binding NifX family protein